MSIHTMTLDLGIFGEHDVRIKYHYAPEERQTRWEQGCPEEFEIESIDAIIKTDSGTKYVDISFLDNNDFEDIIELLKKDLRDNV